MGYKYIKEPHPKSIYGFMNSDPSPGIAPATDSRSLTICNGSEGCYQRAYDNSKTGIVITSPLIESVIEMTARLLVSKDVCTLDDINLVVNSTARDSSTFFSFKKTCTGLWLFS